MKINIFWSGYGLASYKQQAITWTNDDQDVWCHMVSVAYSQLIHCGRVTHICVVKLTIIGSDNGLSPGRRQAIIWTNDGILLIGPLGTNFIEILIGIQTFSFKKMHLKMSSAKWRPFRLGLNVLTLRIQHGQFLLVILNESYSPWMFWNRWKQEKLWQKQV